VLNRNRSDSSNKKHAWRFNNSLPGCGKLHAGSCINQSTMQERHCTSKLNKIDGCGNKNKELDSLRERPAGSWSIIPFFQGASVRLSTTVCRALPLAHNAACWPSRQESCANTVVCCTAAHLHMVCGRYGHHVVPCPSHRHSHDYHWQSGERYRTAGRQRVHGKKVPFRKLQYLLDGQGKINTKKVVFASGGLNRWRRTSAT
jgi:hypothetical protein